MRSDYTELSSEVRVKVTKDLETLRVLKERVKEAMVEGREAVSSYNWRQRLNETMTVFDDIKTDTLLRLVFTGMTATALTHFLLYFGNLRLENTWGDEVK